MGLGGGGVEMMVVVVVVVYVCMCVCVCVCMWVYGGDGGEYRLIPIEQALANTSSFVIAVFTLMISYNAPITNWCQFLLFTSTARRCPCHTDL